MAVVSNPLIGKTRQSMGNATFSSWKGINVLKEKPQSVANPRSDGQLQQRSAFKQLVEAFRRQPSAIRAGFKSLAIRKSEFNAFMAANLDQAFNRATPGVALLIPANLVTSKGTIAGTSPTSVVPDRSNNTIAANWSSAVLQPGQSVTDKAMISCYNATKNEFTGEVTNVSRSANTATIPMPAGWQAGDIVTVYLAFTNGLSGESSDSAAVTTPLVA
jgi:hypothetical protein